MITKIPSNHRAILLTVGGELLEVDVKAYQSNLHYGKGNLSNLTAKSGPAYEIQHRNKRYDASSQAWVSESWSPWRKVWIEPTRLFLTTDLEGALQACSQQSGSLGSSSGGGASASAGSGPSPKCGDCGGNRKHVRLDSGSWCPKSRKAQVAEKLATEASQMFDAHQ